MLIDVDVHPNYLRVTIKGKRKAASLEIFAAEYAKVLTLASCRV